MTFKAHLITTERGIEPDYFTTRDEVKHYTVEDVLTTNAGSFNAAELHAVIGFAFCKLKFMEWLFASENWHYMENDKDKTMSYDIRNEYIVLNYHPANTLVVTTFEVKYKQNFTSWDQVEDLEAADHWKRATCSLDAKAQFWETFNPNIAHGRNIARLNFPEATKNELSHLKEAKKSTTQYMYYKPGEYTNIYSYDIKQSYPARVYHKYCPVGKGKYFTCDDQIPARYWYIRRVRITEISARCTFDFLGLLDKKLPCYVTLTQQSIAILNAYYMGKWSMLDGYAYKLRRGLFDRMYDTNFKDPGNSKPHIKRYNKFRNNLLIGTFGANDQARTLYSIEAGELKTTFVADKPAHKYLPVYLHVVSAARLALVQIIYENRDAIIYANADGVFATRELQLIQPVLPGQPGEIELRGLYKRLAIKAISDYCGEHIDKDGVVVIDEKLKGRRLVSEANYAEYIAGTLRTETPVVDKSGAVYMVDFPEISLQAAIYATTHETPTLD